MSSKKALCTAYYGKHPVTLEQYRVAIPYNPDYITSGGDNHIEYYTKTQCNTIFLLVEYTFNNIIFLFKLSIENDSVVMRTCENQERMKELFPEIVMAHSL